MAEILDDRCRGVEKMIKMVETKKLDHSLRKRLQCAFLEGDYLFGLPANP
ncbi:hypothetical protein HPP92_025858 [Vanilla planifolia]|uniref:Uncharacterized protein n=1 Tax=Vanilla planifolia TaxID=51239 RepID=A0A835PH93_VANPL|nr:hypothetical protein HPP92_025858 [Vanilla planifolia]